MTEGPVQRSIAPSSEDSMDELESALRDISSHLSALCGGLEKKFRQISDSFSAMSATSFQLLQCSHEVGDTFPDLGKWIEIVGNINRDANSLHTILARSWMENFIEPLNSFLKDSTKKMKSCAKTHSKSLTALENAQMKVRLCREKGKQTNMIKLLELEQERDVCSKTAELTSINRASTLKRVQEQLQVETLDAVHSLLGSYRDYYRQGLEIFTNTEQQLPQLQQLVTRKREALEGEVELSVQDAIQSVLDSDQKVTNKTPSPLACLPQSVRDYLQQQVPKFAVSTSGKFKHSDEEAEVDLSVSPACLLLTNMKDQTITSLPVDQVLQISRIPRADTKLKIQWKNRDKATEIAFADRVQRERFLELLSFGTRCYHAEVDREDPLRIWIGSWNMGDAAPPSDLEELGRWIPLQGYDLYVVGTQECMYKPKSATADETPEAMGSGCEADWFARVQNLLGNEFVRVCGLSLMGIRLLILVHRTKWFKISNVQKSTEACGIANLVGNKGAVGIAFHYNETRLIFVNSHLAAHMEKWEDRNQNYAQIVANLNLISGTSNPVCKFTNYFHHVFWMGDLNYRLDDDRENVLAKIHSRQYEDLMLNDQLTRERIWGNAFAGFQEGPLTFPPTYRYCRGVNEYSDEKMRVPSWCDRILWRSLPQCQVEQVHYDSTDDILTSDHHPISGSFVVPTYYPNVPHVPSKPCHVKFLELEASGLNMETNSCSILLLSDIFTQSYSTPVSKKTGTNPVWSKDELQPVEVMTTNEEHIRQEHVFAIIRDQSKKKEVIELGQCAISLHDACGSRPVPFQCKIQYRGRIQGNLKGVIQVSWSRERVDSYPLAAFTMKKGYLLKKTRRKWDREFFVLTPTYLLGFDSESASSEKPSRLILIKNCLVHDLESEKSNEFSIETPKKTITFCASSEDDKNEWIEAIRSLSRDRGSPQSPLRLERSFTSPRDLVVSPRRVGNVSPENSPTWERKTATARNRPIDRENSPLQADRKAQWAGMKPTLSSTSSRDLLGSRPSHLGATRVNSNPEKEDPPPQMEAPPPPSDEGTPL